MGPRGTNTPHCPPLSPVSLFIALQSQFTGSSGNQGQVQRYDWGKDGGKGLLELTDFTQVTTSLTSKVQITPDSIPQAHPTWPSPSLPASRNLCLANVTSSKGKERGLQQALTRRKSNQGSYLKPKACFPEHGGQGTETLLFEAALKPPFGKQVSCPSSLHTNCNWHPQFSLYHPVETPGG